MKQCAGLILDIKDSVMTSIETACVGSPHWAGLWHCDRLQGIEPQMNANERKWCSVGTGWPMDPCFICVHLRSFAVQCLASSRSHAHRADDWFRRTIRNLGPQTRARSA
jgi:hypothetical protein